MEKTTLLSSSHREWLAQDHEVHFLFSLVEELDLSQAPIAAQAKDPHEEKCEVSTFYWTILAHVNGAPHGRDWVQAQYSPRREF